MIVLSFLWAKQKKNHKIYNLYTTLSIEDIVHQP